MGRRIAGADDWPYSRCCWTSVFDNLMVQDLASVALKY